MNPEDFTTDKVRGYVSSGVNRIVLGIQSLNKALRRTIGRRGNTEVRKILDKFFLQQGFNRCIDLITGIPGQTYENCLEDLIIISGYRPEHISLYLLSVERGTPLSERLITDDLFDDMQLTVWGRSIDFLVNEGYNHYEISNFSLPGFESIHNSKYWHFIPYAGFGAGAHSFTGSTRYSNNMLLNDYIRQKHAVYTFDNRNESDIVVEFFMTALRDLRGFTAV
jgi:oxygen-independent coproporphyrinogen-3 oxidase